MRLLSLSVATLLAVPALAQDSNTALGVKAKVNQRAEEESSRAESAGSIDEGDEGSADTDEGGGADEGGGDAAEAPAAEAPAAAEGDTPANAPESYTVLPGDTLWGLSQRFLNNPWYWPKVWSYNPGFDNPNWIRPGATVRFYPGAEAPVVEAAPDQQEEPEEMDTEFVDIPLFEGEKNVQQNIDQLANLEAAGYRREFFVPVDQVEDSGRILNAPEDKVMLADYDAAYVKLKKGGAGDTFQVFRAERDVIHPVTGALLGKLVTLRGEIRVDTVSKDQSLAHVTRAWDDITRGDYLGEIKTFDDSGVRPEANTTNVKGYLVSHGSTPLAHVGGNFTVIVDKGKSDGVKTGNIFTVVRAGDPYTRQYSGMVDEDIGHIMVIEVFDKTSKGVVVDSSRELVPGDRIEMRVK